MEFDLATILTLVLGAVATFLGTYLAIAKGKLKKVITAGKELIDVAKALEEALADNKIDQAELDNIKLQWTEAKAALKAVITKD